MRLSTPKRTRSYRPSAESIADAKATVARLTGVRLDAAQVANLDDAEAAELVQLTWRITHDEHGQQATNRSRLSPKEARRWEALIEGAAEASGHFQRLRERASTKTKLNELARKARTPRREPWEPPVGSVVFLSADLIPMLEDAAPALWISHLGVLTLVLAQIENGIPLSPGARFEGAEDDDLVLVLDRNWGLGSKFDPDGHGLGGWEKRLAHLSRNGWLHIEHRGHEIHVRRGRRALRAVKEGQS
jgi:hypothetical protein